MVEDWAHRADGHFPVRFAELAAGFAQAGCAVDVLVGRGWAHARDAAPFPFRLHRYGPFGRWLSGVAERLTLTHGAGRLAAWSPALGSTLRALVLVRAARALRLRAPGAAADVIVVSYGLDPVRMAAIAGPGSWFLYQFEPPPDPPPDPTSIRSRISSAFARRAEARRRRADGCACIVAPTEEWANAWAARAPFLRTSTTPIAGARTCAPIPDARARLGLTSDDRLALVFGSTHAMKDYDVVWRAFAALSAWRLLIVGRIADAYATALPLPSPKREPVVIGGDVENATRDLVHAAADLIVLSFRPDHSRESGVIMDAIAWGVPVVCSARSVAADIVTAYGLGVLFEPGDAASLIRAVSSAPARIRPEDLDRVRRDYSNAAVAQRIIGVLHPTEDPARGG